MSRRGRWRLFRAGLCKLAGLLGLAVLAWGGWLLAGVLQENSSRMPEAAKSVPIQPPDLTTDGVLDHAWLAPILALPPGVSLMELDLEQLRARLLEDGQVLTATLTRHFPDRLAVAITERSPIARVMAQWGGQRQPLLVARDGIIFGGRGHDPALIDLLPWLDGIAIARRGGTFLPIEGMETVGQLLARARLEAEHLYRTWRVVSLARLETDRELEVRTEPGVTIVFNARGDFFRQLAKLDYIWDKVLGAPGGSAHIDLTLGREVPVMIEPAPPAVSTLPPSRPNSHRELQ